MFTLKTLAYHYMFTLPTCWDLDEIPWRPLWLNVKLIIMGTYAKLWLKRHWTSLWKKMWIVCSVERSHMRGYHPVAHHDFAERTTGSRSAEGFQMLHHTLRQCCTKHHLDPLKRLQEIELYVDFARSILTLSLDVWCLWLHLPNRILSWQAATQASWCLGVKPLQRVIVWTTQNN